MAADDKGFNGDAFYRALETTVTARSTRGNKSPPKLV